MKNCPLKLLAVCNLIAVCTGCATILSGRSQTISVNTNPVGARCELFREGRIVGAVESTPGAVTLNKTKYDIDVICKKDGYLESKEFAKSGTEGATFGNIILSGGIGWAVDSAAGTDNKYPEVVTVTLLPVPEAPVVSTAKQTAAISSGAKGDVRRRLEDLKKMKEDGLLAEEEYQKKRSEIIGKL